jgi:uncharacterized protein (DUF2384 family)
MGQVMVQIERDDPMALSIVDTLERETAKKTIDVARGAFGLNYVDIASALDIDRRTLLRYRQLLNTPVPQVRDRLETLRQIAFLMDELFVSREDGLRWLYESVPLLQGRRPIDLIRKGELNEVLSILAGLYSGSHF